MAMTPDMYRKELDRLNKVISTWQTIAYRTQNGETVLRLVEPGDAFHILDRLETAEKVCEWYRGRGSSHARDCCCDGCESLNAWIALKEQSNDQATSD